MPRASITCYVRPLVIKLAVILTALLCSACGGGRSGGPDQQGDELRSDGELLSSRHASLHILPETYQAGGSARKLVLNEREQEGEILLELSAVDADRLKSLYLHLDYDAKQFSPAGVESEWRFAEQADTLQLSLANESGVLEYGEQCARPDEPAIDGGRKGFDGDGLLATIRLARRPFAPAAVEREVLTPTVAKRSQSILSLNVDSFELSWGYANNGDYNQNGAVAVTDLTPIGAHFGEDVPGDDQNSIQAVIDGNGDGKIGVADLTAIGLNFNVIVNSYNIYASKDIADLPTVNDGPNGAGAELRGSVPFTAVQGGQFDARRSFNFVLPLSQIGWFYWVRPNDAADGAGADGTPSSVASFGGNGDNLDPLAVLSADPSSGGTPLDVNFDAGASSDPDGLTATVADLVQFQWDFDGNGVIDDVTTEPTVSHRFNNSGFFDVTVKVFDTGAAFGSASTRVSVGVLGNNTPIAELTASVSSGQAPIFVRLDASGSENGEGSGDGLIFEWDFEGDGVFDLSSGRIVDHLYSTVGNFNPTVRVTDDIDQQATKSTPLEVLENTGNQPPIAVLQPSPIEGDTGDSNFLRQELDISQCSDPDGTVAVVAFDVNSDGRFEIRREFNPGSNLANARFNVQLRPGISTGTLLVQDNLGTSTTTTAEVRITKNGNFPPLADLQVDLLSGDKPLLVNLDASGSSDPDGSIAEFAFELDGDFSTEFETLDADGLLSHLIENGGEAFLSVRVTDNLGLSSTDTVIVEVSAPGNQPPQAAFSLSAGSGDAPLKVIIDPSASVDADGSVLSFDWDFSGDGDLDSEQRRSSPEPFEHTFMQKGDTVITLRVTDNDGATDFSTETVSLNNGWEFATVAGNFRGSSQGNNFSEALALTSVPGEAGGPRRAALAYVPTQPGGEDFGTAASLLYAQSDPADPLSWSVPVAVLEVNDVPGSDVGQRRNGFELIDAGNLALDFVDGRPAIAFGGLEAVDGVVNSAGLYFSRAADQQGTQWPVPLQIPFTVGISEALQVNMAQVGGRPAISFLHTTDDGTELSFMRSLDVAGGQWPAATPLQQFDFTSIIQQSKLLVSEGIPAVSFSELKISEDFSTTVSTKLFHIRALEAEGTSWGSVSEIDADVRLGPQLADHAIVNGNPAAAYQIETAGARQGSFSRGNATDGDFPADPALLAPGLSFDFTGSISLALAGNIPCVAHTGFIFGENSTVQALFLSVAEDANGSSWSAPAIVIADADVEVGTCRMLRLNSDLLITFDDSGDELLKVALFRNFAAF